MRQPDNLPAFCRVHRNGRPLIGRSGRCRHAERPNLSASAGGRREAAGRRSAAVRLPVPGRGRSPTVAYPGLGRQAGSGGGPGVRVWWRAVPGQRPGDGLRRFSGCRHLIEQPMPGRCGSGTGWPARVSSMAARSSSPVTGLPLPGVDWSNAPR